MGDFSGTLLTKELKFKSKLLKREALANLLDTGDYSDVKFVVSFIDLQKRELKQDFKCHKLILALNSPLFHKTFLNANLPTDQLQLIVFPVANTKPKIFNMLIKFIYMKSVRSESVKDLVSLYELAERYDVITLKEAILELVASDGCDDAVMGFYSYAVETNNRILLDICTPRLRHSLVQGIKNGRTMSLNKLAAARSSSNDRLQQNFEQMSNTEDVKPMMTSSDRDPIKCSNESGILIPPPVYAMSSNKLLSSTVETFFNTGCNAIRNSNAVLELLHPNTNLPKSIKLDSNFASTTFNVPKIESVKSDYLENASVRRPESPRVRAPSVDGSTEGKGRWLPGWNDSDYGTEYLGYDDVKLRRQALITAEMASVIIGRGGIKITEIQRTIHAEVSVAPLILGDPNERLLKVDGSAQAVNDAEVIITDWLCEHEMIEEGMGLDWKEKYKVWKAETDAPVAVDSGLLMALRAAVKTTHNGFLCKEVMISDYSVAASIIGNKGERVKRIIQQSGASVRIFDSEAEGKPQLMRIKGLKAQIFAATDLLETLFEHFGRCQFLRGGGRCRCEVALNRI